MIGERAQTQNCGQAASYAMDPITTSFPQLNRPWGDVSDMNVWILATPQPQTVLYQFKRGGGSKSSIGKSSWSSWSSGRSSSYTTYRSYSSSRSSGGIFGLIVIVVVVLIFLFVCVMIHLKWKARKDESEADARDQQLEGRDGSLPRLTPCTNTAFFGLRNEETQVVNPVDIIVHPAPYYSSAPAEEPWQMPPYPLAFSNTPSSLPPYPESTSQLPLCHVTSELPHYSSSPSNLSSYPVSSTPFPINLPSYPVPPFHLPSYPSHSAHLPPYPASSDLPMTSIVHPSYPVSIPIQNPLSPEPTSLPYIGHSYRSTPNLCTENNSQPK